MTRQYTFELFEEDCVGNDVGKHNFNALSLETKVCNISSQFFNTDTSLLALSAFSEQMDTVFLYGNVGRYNTASTTVSLLSTHWGHHEFSVLYELNISTKVNQDFIQPTVFNPVEHLTFLSTLYLNKNFPTKNFPTGTKVNVCMFLYTQTVTPYREGDSLNMDGLATQTYTNKEFSFWQRYVTGYFGRKDVHFEYGRILKFANADGVWTLINIIEPTVPSQTNRTQITININSNVNNYNVADVVLRKDYVAGKTDVVIHISSSAIVGSKSVDSPAMTLANLRTGDSVIIFNYGLIIGAGGTGGNGGNAPDTGSVKGNNGSRGGTAIAAFVPTIIENHGRIYGGGGGGAGGTGGVTGSNSTGGGGGGGAGVFGGKGGRRGVNAIFKSKNLIITDSTPGADTSGGSGGPGLCDVNARIQNADASTSLASDLAKGTDGGNIGERALDSNSALGGAAGYYLLGNPNVYWAVPGETKGDLL